MQQLLSSLPPTSRIVLVAAARVRSCSRYIDSYALFGHAGVHTRTHPAFAYLIIRPEPIELQFARLEVSQTALISLCTCRTRLYSRVDRYAADNSLMSFLRSKL